MNTTEYRTKLIKRIEELDKLTGFVGNHGLRFKTEMMLEEFLIKYEKEVKDKVAEKEIDADLLLEYLSNGGEPF